MHFNKLSDDLSVSPQIVPAKMAAIKAAGYKSIICNRPDGEQPTFSQIEAAAKAAGLTAAICRSCLEAFRAQTAKHSQD